MKELSKETVEMRVAEIGDNCIDLYERIGEKISTGNVVDTGVNLQNLESLFRLSSTTGNDENGKWMLRRAKGVDISRFKNWRWCYSSNLYGYGWKRAVAWRLCRRCIGEYCF